MSLPYSAGKAGRNSDDDKTSLMGTRHYHSGGEESFELASSDEGNWDMQERSRLSDTFHQGRARHELSMHIGDSRGELHHALANKSCCWLVSWSLFAATIVVLALVGAASLCDVYTQGPAVVKAAGAPPSFSYQSSADDLVIAPKHHPRIGIHTLMFGSGKRHGGLLWLNVAPPRDDTPGQAVKYLTALNETTSRPDYTFSLEEYFKLSMGTVARYAERWNYPYWIGDQKIIEGPQGSGMTGMWSKEAMTLSLLLDELRKPVEERLEWILFLDADFVIMNQRVPLSAFLPPIDGPYADIAKQQIILLAQDRWNSANSGSYLLRVCEESVRLMVQVQAQALKAFRSSAGFGQGEQTALTRAISHDAFNDKVTILPAHFINADAFDLFDYPEHWANKESYRIGDFGIHFQTEKRKGWDRVLRWSTSSDANFVNDTLSVPFEQTRYASGEASVARHYEDWYSLTTEQRRSRVKRFDQG